MIMKKRVLSAVLLVAFMSVAVLAEEVGSVKIPRDVMINKVPVAAGTYDVHLVQSGDKMMIELHKGDATVVSELAIVKAVDMKSKYGKYNDGVVYEPLRKDGNEDPLISRVLIKKGGNLFLLFCEK